MSNWDTGPELLISTKRMDSSFGKNAANRVEESYGDAKNLRLRHPMAALGFVYGLRTTIMQESPDKAAWLIDLLQKLGREDDAYHAVALIMIEYGNDVAVDGDDEGDGDGDAFAEAGVGGSEVLNDGDDEISPVEPVEPDAVDEVLRSLPTVVLRDDYVPENLSAGRFLNEMGTRVLDSTPINFHEKARQLRSGVI